MNLDVVSLSKYRKVLMSFIRIVRLFLCSDCRKVISDVFDLLSNSEELDKRQ